MVAESHVNVEAALKTIEGTEDDYITLPRSVAARMHIVSSRNLVANSQHGVPQESPVGFVSAGLKPRNSTMSFRCPSVGWFWFFSHFSMAVSVIPKPSILASCVMDSCISTLFL